MTDPAAPSSATASPADTITIRPMAEADVEPAWLCAERSLASMTRRYSHR